MRAVGPDSAPSDGPRVIEALSRPKPPTVSGNGPEPNEAGILVADFFSGMGGLSLGFLGDGFRLHGFDHDPAAVAAYRLNVAHAVAWDARSGYPELSPDIVLGGPPCRPWSVVNLTNRGAEHRDFHLVHDLVEAIGRYQPRAFAIENVPAVRSHLETEVAALRELGYSVEGRVVRYADWGAPSRRRRFFVLGVEKGSAATLWKVLENMKTQERTVEDAIGQFRSLARDAFADHEWGQFQTIDRYKEKYETGQYGWCRLKWDEPAPSFGNVSKTYILHPDEARVLSVREAIAVLGFPDSYVFPAGVARTSKYRMAADAVSPPFSKALALVLGRHLAGELEGADSTDATYQLAAR